MPGRRRTGSRPSSTSMSRAVYSPSALDARGADLDAPFPFCSADAKRSVEGFDLASAFRGLAIGLHIVCGSCIGESRLADYATAGPKKWQEPGRERCDLWGTTRRRPL